MDFSLDHWMSGLGPLGRESLRTYIALKIQVEPGQAGWRKFPDLRSATL